MGDVPRPFRAEELLEHLPALRGLARALVRGDEVEDLVAETVARAWERPPRHRRNVRAWLTATLRNLAADRGRRAGARASRHERVRATARSASAEAAATPDEALARAEALHQLHAELHALDEDDRHLLHLRYFEGLNATEIGTRLALPPSTVRNRLARALGRLRARLRDRYGADAFAPCWLLLEPLAPPAAASAGPVIALTTATMANSTKILLGLAAALLLIPVSAILLGPDGSRQSEARLVAEADPRITASEDTGGKTPAAPSPENAVVREPAPFDLAPVEDDGCWVTVLEAGSREPVAGAEVLVKDGGFHRAEGFRAALEQDPNLEWDVERLTRRFGRTFRTDSEGRVNVPLFSSRFGYVLATTEKGFGRAHVDAIVPEDVHELEVLLRERVHLEVRVIGSDGGGAEGVRVAYQWQHPNGRRFSSLFAVTDESGTALIRNVQGALTTGQGEGRRHFVAALTGTQEPLQVEFDPTSPPEDPIVLRLPRQVALHVILSEEDFPKTGSPGFPIELVAGSPDQAEEHFFGPSPSGNQRRAHTEIHDRLAVFERVEAGFVGYIALQIGSHEEFLWQRVEILESSPGPHVVRLRPLAARPGFQVRVVGAGGEPRDDVAWSGRAFELRAREPRNKAFYLAAQAGTTATVDERPDYVQAHPIERSYRITVKHEASEHEVWIGYRDLDADTLPPDDRTVDIVYADQLLISGTVVDSQGTRLSGVQVDAYGSVRETARPNSVVTVNGRVVTDDEGRFEIRGSRGTLSMMSLILPGHGHQYVDFVEGLPDQRFVIELESKIRGALLVDPGVPPSFLKIRIASADGVERNRATKPDADGRFEVGFIQPGAVEVVVEDSFGRELLRSRTIELEAGGVASQDGLPPFDLRGRLTTHRVRVVGSAGTTVGRIALHEAATGGVCEGTSPLSFVTENPRESVLVDAWGHGVVGPVVVEGDTEVRVGDGVSVAIELPHGVTLENDERKWVLAFDAQFDVPGGVRLSREFFLEGDIAIDLPAPGRWEISLTSQGYWPDLTPRERRRPVPLDENGSILVEVPPDGLAEPVLLPLTQEIVNAAIEG